MKLFLKIYYSSSYFIFIPNCLNVFSRGKESYAEIVLDMSNTTFCINKISNPIVN